MNHDLQMQAVSVDAGSEAQTAPLSGAGALPAGGGAGVWSTARRRFEARHLRAPTDDGFHLFRVF